MYNPRTKPESASLLSKPSFPPSPSVSRNCNSPSLPRRPSSTDGGKELVKTRWSGYKKVQPNTVTSKQGQALTRIPRLPQGKENLRGGGRGARVVKPVARPKQSSLTEISPPSEPNDEGAPYTSIKANITVNSTPIRPGARSPVFISSKAVPDLHNKILAKIRLNKRKSRSRNTSSLQSSFKASKAPDDMEEFSTTRAILDKEDEFEKDRESPVSGQDLEAYLASMFYMVDTYRTGLVRSSSLLEYLGSLVDLPKLDKWKLEELNRLLDPDKDNRYVDQALWSKVGQAWVEMMMDPGNHVDTSLGGSVEVEDEQDSGEVDQDINSTGNASYGSYGSVEGVGGDPGCSSREVELENKVSELRYQLVRLGEEKAELERNLAGSEELAQTLATELEGSQKVMVNMSSSFHRGEVVNEETEQVKEVQEQCCSLTMKNEDLTRELQEKDDKLLDMEVMMISVKEEIEECKIREELMNKKLVEKFKKCSLMEAELQEKIDQVNIERTAREDAEGKLEVTQVKLHRLESELSVKDEEIRNLTRSRLESVESGGNISNSIHDVSVDDRVIEENFDTQAGAVPVFITPSRVTHSPAKRGPSASSTPHKGRKGSIADELQDLEASSGLPSPFCEKKDKGGRVRGEVMKILEMMGESVRKIMVNQVKPGQSGRAMVLLNKELVNVKKELDRKLESLTSSDEMKELREKAFDLEEKLSEAKLEIKKLEKAKVNVDDKDNIPAEIVQQVETRVEAMASLLQTTNSALLAATEGAETPPDCSLEPESDLSSWQLDLEGIQLVDWNSQLGKRLAHYTRCGKKNSLAELSCRSPMAIATSLLKPELMRSPAPNGLLWQSLYKRLEDLQSATEVSRDLLTMAGDSMREQSVNQSSIMFPKTVSCQTSTSTQSKASQADGPDSANQSAQTDQSLLHSPSSSCLVENCFCSSSQTRATASLGYRLLRTAGSLILIVLAFTFLCGLEIEQDLYYPITWYPLRQALGDWLPTPAILLSYKTTPSQIW